MPRVTSTHAAAWTFRIVAWTTIAWLLGWRGVALLAAAAIATQALAFAIHALRDQPAAARTLTSAGVGAAVLLFLSTLWAPTRSVGLPAGTAVFMCLAVAYLIDVQRGSVAPRRAFAGLVYLLQFPVFPAGPLSRFHDFAEQLSHSDVSMAGFSYGVRRIATGLTKVYLLAAPLGSTADAIFALRVTERSTDTAWLGAVCAALQAYYYVSGFSDVGIGIGKMLGFRYQENFRRPFTADSIREFWRRWNVTLMTWLRDYFSLPIAGHERWRPELYLLTIVGFVIVGGWQHHTMRVVPWAIYFATWLSIEAAGLGAALRRTPRVIRHTYVLLVVIFGWLLVRASGPGPLLGYVEAMLGFSVVKFGGAGAYLTWDVATALVFAIVFAGPMIGNISRWRVSVDAATASLLMMFAATGIFIWHALVLLRRAVLPRTPPRRSH